ncbi:MAG TPA: PIN domain-containing protein [Solirubrobacteraceae bacterium]|nr:PIN domain-containing protein [Solirubrobacteraceae bacterium]
MARVALDADIVIAFLDPGDDQHTTAVAELRPRLAAGDQLLAAATVYAESLVRPLQQGTDAIIDEFFDAAGISIVPIDRAVARRAAVLRAEHQSLRLPDAMSLATAIMSDSALLTLDKKLRQIARRVQPSP